MEKTVVDCWLTVSRLSAHCRPTVGPLSDFIDLLGRKIICLTDTSNLIIVGDWNTTLSALTSKVASHGKTLQELSNLFYERDQSYRYLSYNSSQKQNLHLQVNACDPFRGRHLCATTHVNRQRFHCACICTILQKGLNMQMLDVHLYVIYCQFSLFGIVVLKRRNLIVN